jgi:hypothetical protein
VALTARLDAAPFQNKVKIRVFAQVVKPHPSKQIHNQNAVSKQNQNLEISPTP